MPNRILKDSICTSDDINGLSDKEEILFYRLIVQCDDYGRFDGRASIIRSKCFPLKLDDIKDKDIEKWLSTLAKAGLIRFYMVDNKRYLMMTSWSKHQQVRSKRSKYPQPISDDINGYQMISDDSICTRESESESESISESESELTNDGFGRFWESYPKKVAKVAAEKAFNKISPNEFLLSDILMSVEKWKRTAAWTKDGGQYIPNAATWLNGRRWEDEVPQNKSDDKWGDFA